MATDRIGRPPPPAPKLSSASPVSKPQGSTNVVAPKNVNADGMDRSRARNAAAVNALMSTTRADFFAQARDGFVAFDPSTRQVVGGHAAGVALRDGELQGTPLENLLKVFARGVPNGDVVFRVGDAKVNPPGTTDAHGLQSLPIDALGNAVKGVDAKRGGLIDVGLEAKDSAPGRARVLALPKDYDGPIFISDIDETLRMTKYGKVLNGDVQPPIEGAKELLEGVSAQGAPIVYLSAGAPNIRPSNEKFLAQLPPGVLLNQDDYPLENLAPDNALRTKLQAEYKTQMLNALREAYPNAKLFGLGDDKYGDAIAYQNAGATTYVHNVDATQKNLPPGFHGVVTNVYSKDFIAKVEADVGAAVKTSRSFGGDPSAKVATPEWTFNPEPIAHRSLKEQLERHVEDLVALGRHVPSALKNALTSRLEGGEETLAAVSKMTDAELSSLPVDSLAAMTEALLRNGILAKLARNSVDGTKASEQVLRLITAHGTDAGAMDAVLSRVDVNVAEKLTGPARATYLSLRQSGEPKLGDWAGLSAYLDRATGTTVRDGSTVTPLINGEVAFPAMTAAIDAASSTVNLSVFSFRSDQAGWDMARHLAAAADRGVTVRVLYDRMGSYKSSGTRTDPAMYEFMRQHGVDVIEVSPEALGAQLNHRKITVIDGNRAFTGGMNIGDEFRYEWHDVHSEVRGPAVADLQRLFVDQWKREGGKVSDESKLFPTLAKEPKSFGVRVIGHEGLNDRNIQLAYLRAIDTAETSIRIASPYFTDPTVVAHLERAAKRGVRVDVVLPKVNDKGIVQVAERALYQQLRDAGIHVYEYKGHSMAHDKVATFDGKVATIGSSNLDARSLHSNDEDNVWVHDEKLAAKLNAELFDRDITQSDVIDTYKPGILHMTIENLVKRFANFL